MKEKIKSLFAFLGRAWAGGIRGKVGVICAAFALFVLVRMFFGEVTVQAFIGNIWKLQSEQKQLASEQARSEEITRHIKLMQQNSPDYVEELAQKYLNLGDPKTRILKI